MFLPIGALLVGVRIVAWLLLFFVFSATAAALMDARVTAVLILAATLAGMAGGWKVFVKAG